AAVRVVGDFGHLEGVFGPAGDRPGAGGDGLAERLHVEPHPVPDSQPATVGVRHWWAPFMVRTARVKPMTRPATPRRGELAVNWRAPVPMHKPATQRPGQ